MPFRGGLGRLGSLPREIRDQIWKLVLPSRITIAAPLGTARGRPEQIGNIGNNLTSVSLVSRQFYEELIRPFCGSLYLLFEILDPHSTGCQTSLRRDSEVAYRLPVVPGDVLLCCCLNEQERQAKHKHYSRILRNLPYRLLRGIRIGMYALFRVDEFEHELLLARRALHGVSDLLVEAHKRHGRQLPQVEFTTLGGVWSNEVDNDLQEFHRRDFIQLSEVSFHVEGGRMALLFAALRTIHMRVPIVIKTRQENIDCFEEEYGRGLYGRETKWVFDPTLEHPWALQWTCEYVDDGSTRCVTALDGAYRAIDEYLMDTMEDNMVSELRSGECLLSGSQFCMSEDFLIVVRCTVYRHSICPKVLSC